jgi:predicted MFS family arabinose efflux permease
MGAYGAGHFLACLIGGQMAVAWGRRPSLVFSMFSTAVVMLALSQARSFAAISILTFFAGLTGELYRPACSALLADLPTVVPVLTERLAGRVAAASGVEQLIDALGPLARAVRYGDVRSTDVSALADVVDGFVRRICVENGIPL